MVWNSHTGLWEPERARHTPESSGEEWTDGVERLEFCLCCGYDHCAKRERLPGVVRQHLSEVAGGKLADIVKRQPGHYEAVRQVVRRCAARVGR